MQETRCDVLIVGGGTGGVAAALAASTMGLSVMLTEETDWIGGQLTSQAVPPDEHPWIEMFGCTARYRIFRSRVRRMMDGPKPMQMRTYNPGGGWVSNLCFPPPVGQDVLRGMLAEHPVDLRLRTVAQGTALLTSTVPRETGAMRPEVEGDRVTTVPLLDLETGEETLVRAAYVLDATELGDLLPLTETEFVQGAEGRDETGEAHAPPHARQDDQQGFTWCMAVGYAPGEDRTIEKPEGYERWAAYAPEGWRGRLFDYGDLAPATNLPREIPLIAKDGGLDWFTYRQVERPREGTHGATVVNWPQNDYFVRPLTDPEPWIALDESRQLSLSWLYWMQTEGGAPGLHLRPDLTGTPDGLAKTPYVRESRRIRAMRTIREGDVTPKGDEDRAPEMAHSVGVGAYRIDLHFSTGGERYLDIGTLPFQIPLGALIPRRVRNLLPACKNVGTTHITNGCTRLHPVEWNVGESAGLLAAFCLQSGTEPHAVHASPALTEAFQGLLHAQGVETAWPRLRAL